MSGYPWFSPNLLRQAPRRQFEPDDFQREDPSGLRANSNCFPSAVSSDSFDSKAFT
jgi:hypothetical protein